MLVAALNERVTPGTALFDESHAVAHDFDIWTMRVIASKRMSF